MAAVKHDFAAYEFQGPTWIKLKKYLEARQALLRAKNDASVDAAKTEKLRGRLAEIKHLLALDQPTPQAESDTE